MIITIGIKKSKLSILRNKSKMNLIKILIFTISIICISSCKKKSVSIELTKNEDSKKKEIIHKKDTTSYYVTAKSGLNARKSHNGEVIFKYEYGTKLKIFERTGKFQEIKDEHKIIKGEWVSIKEKDQIVYIFDAFLSKKKLEINRRNINNLKIFTTDRFENNKKFVVLTDSGNFKIHYTDSTIFIPKKYLGQEYINEQSINRELFLKYSNVKENDSVFIYSYHINDIKSYKVKDLPLLARLTPYDNGDQPYTQFDYFIGLGLPTNIKGENFISISKENPFIKGNVEPFVWNKIDSIDFPKVTLFSFEHKKFKSNNFSFKHYEFRSNNNLTYYLKKINNTARYETILHIVVTDMKQNIIYNNHFYESDGIEFYTYDFENKGEINQFTGKIFKDLPPVFWGFLIHSFGCPDINIINKKNELVEILCDNRH